MIFKQSPSHVQKKSIIYWSICNLRANGNATIHPSIAHSSFPLSVDKYVNKRTTHHVAISLSRYCVSVMFSNHQPIIYNFHCVSVCSSKSYNNHSVPHRPYVCVKQKQSIVEKKNSSTSIHKCFHFHCDQGNRIKSIIVQINIWFDSKMLAEQQKTAICNVVSRFVSKFVLWYLLKKKFFLHLRHK